MPITVREANTLCADVVDSMAAWPTLYTAMQSGGFEKNGTYIINKSLEKLVTSRNAANAPGVSDSIILREYRQIDYAIITSTIAQQKLSVETVIEVKCNYAYQLGEITARVPGGINQACGYCQEEAVAADAYVLYFVAAPYINALPLPPRNAGWRYWGTPLRPAMLQPAIDVMRIAVNAAGATIIGEASAYASVLGIPPVGVNPNLYCALIKCQCNALNMELAQNPLEPLDS